NIILFLVGLVKLRRYMFVTLLALLPTIFFADLFVKIGSEEKSVGGSSIKVMSYNVGRFKSAAKGLDGDVMERIMEFVKRESPDIMCFQEFSIKDTVLMDRLLTDMPYRCNSLFKGSEHFGNVTFSRFPITDSGKLLFGNSRNSVVWGDFLINGKTVRFYNCHLESSAISFSTLIQKLSKKGKFTDEVLAVHEKLLGTYNRRANQVDILREDIDNCPHPTLICGDFNDTPMTYTYRQLCHQHKDSFVEGGRGFSATYSFLWPVLRIDYLLLPETMDADRHIVSRVPFSDHYPISSLIYL
ncbi:MAG: endonuclease/exonuclease/phosphatase family protein, partial [Bacteroidales bacterium]|nr:endonuclease/exonuclease/phosphatase family protein [Bacteroidales bacterium]